MSDLPRTNAQALFMFLKEFTELRMRAVRSVDQYEDVLWLSEIPHEDECRCSAWFPGREGGDATEIWVEIQKPKLSPPPAPAAELEPWLMADQVNDSCREMPGLRDEIAVRIEDEKGEERIERRRIDDHPEIRQLWEDYVENKWWPWADLDRKRQQVFEAYRKLYSIYTSQQRLGEQYEVILGIGLLTWQMPDGHSVKRHLIAAQTSIEFEAARGVIRVSPAGEGARPVLEQDMIDPQHRPDANLLTALENEVADIGDDIWDITKLQSILAGWANGVSSRGVFDQTLARPERATADPIVHLAPAVILRRRSEHAYARAFSDILHQIEAGAEIPAGVWPFVVPADNQPTEGREPSGDRQTGEIYFPLEANEQQKEIVRRLETHQGVLVQGPPGTGKSHTIVNLVCHLLATGQRILVTSHTPRALSVLRRFFDERTSVIAPLSVILLGDDRLSLEAMERSVQGIMDRYNQWDAAANQSSIRDLEAKLDQARRREANLLGDIRAIRERETYTHAWNFGGYEGTLQSIGERLRHEHGAYHWLTNQPREELEPPLDNNEAQEVLSVLRDGTSNAGDSWPHEAIDTQILLNPSNFDAWVKDEKEAQRRVQDTSSAHAHPAFRPLRNTTAEIRQQILDRTEALLQEIDRMRGHSHAFTEEMVTDTLAGGDGRWRVLLEETKEQVRAIGDRTRWFDQTALTVPEGKDPETMKADAEAALPYVERRGGWGMRLTMPAALKRDLYLRDQVRIGGRRCDTSDAIRDLISWLDVRIHLQHLQRLWEPHTRLSSTTAAALISDADQLCAHIERALHLLETKCWLQTLIASVWQLPEPRWHELASVRDFRSAIVAVEAKLSLAGVASKIEDVANGVRDLIRHAAIDPEATTLLDALQRRDVDAYGHSWSRIGENTERFQRFGRRRALLARLECSAPSLVQELKNSAQDPVWDQRLGQFVDAWNWARARAWLERLSDPREDARLRYALDQEREQIRTLLQEIAAGKAWGHCFDRITEHQRQHLVAWSHAMRRIGRGTGRYAPLHRQAARDHMEECRGAIPAWIIPLYRVVESIRPGKDQFDVAIIDEASQSGPEALLLTYLAKKLVVVGDDKQISPENVGLDREDVSQLRLRHLRPVPHRDRYGADDSFFDLADIIYPGRIRLREHFRCMPEIIQFSNDLCYQAPPLIPLKQYGADRLDPVVEAIRVPDGYVRGATGNIVNEPEAEKIVEYVSTCCEDQKYKGKTFGVISLLGSSQAKLIERRLVERIGPEEMEHRRLTCGDAYAFQGDERDIILLSMVSAASEGRRIGVLTRDTDQRRFNVAASRAREQMILFHSVTLNDLSPQCLRYRLLDYCLHPKVAQPAVGGLNVEELCRAADLADRARTTPPSPFESWFEVDVFLRIADRGYRVVPQYEIAGYRIDLVVEGMQNRLAVECDGDQWHGPDRYEQDVSRQRMLERCGWHFWRLRGSAFSVDPDRAMESLWGELQSNGVFPEGRNVRSAPEHVGDEPVAEEDDPPANRPADRGDTTVIDFPGARAPGRSSDGVPQRQAVPYRVWEPVPLPDLGTASAELLLSGLQKIIDVEGPMLARRAFTLYAKAAGLQRLRDLTRSRLESALSTGLSRKTILAEQEHAGSGRDRLVIRSASTPQVIVRTRGPREFDEIPPSEIAEVMRRALALDGRQSTEETYRRILDHYQLVRMTKGIVAELNRVRDKFLKTAAEKRDPRA